MDFKKYQKATKKTREETARELDIKKSTLDSYLDNKAIPTIDTLMKLADYYGVSLDELCGRETNAIQLPQLNKNQKELLQMILSLNRDNFGIVYGVVLGIYQKQMYQTN